MATYSSDFTIGDKVLIDGNTDLEATVIAITFSPQNQLIHCAWIHNGENREHRIECFRVTQAPNEE